MNDSKPRLTVISGGGGGIGTALVEHLCEDDPYASVALVDLVFPNRVALTKQFGARVAYHECDVTDPQQVHDTINRITTAEHGPLALVNGAGIVSHDASLTLAYDTWASVVGTHLTGTFLLSQAVGNVMATQGGGAIVNIGSIAGLFGHPRRLPYSVAKAGIHQLTKTLAVEWAPLNIRVNAVAPGFVATAMHVKSKELGLTSTELAAELSAMKRMGKPHEIAAAIAFLLSDASSFVTGEVLVVDGGFSVLKAP